MKPEKAAEIIGDTIDMMYASLHEDEIVALKMAYEALKKEVPMEPIVIPELHYADYHCPKCHCNLTLNDLEHEEYCANCGQKLKWSTENDSDSN